MLMFFEKLLDVREESHPAVDVTLRIRDLGSLLRS